jgi:Rod binding domain-containing protein
MTPVPRSAPPGTAPPRTRPAAEEALRHAARAFEAQALGALLQPIFATVDAARGPFGGGAGEAQWRPMLVDAYAAAIARVGGLGIAGMVQRALLRAQENGAAAGTPPRVREGAGT